MNNKFKSDIQDALAEWQEVKTANNDFLYRVRRNFLYYTSLQSSDVYKNKWLIQLEKLGLDPKVMNVIQMYVEGHAGNFTNYVFNPQYYTNNPQLSHVADNLMWLYAEDSNNNSFNSQFTTMILHSCIIRGIIEMKVKRTLNAPLGRITIENIFPDQILFDPSVKSPTIARDSKIAWKKFRMTFKKLMSTFHEKRNEIKKTVEDLSNRVIMQDQSMQGKLEDLENTFMNGEYDVIEAYKIVPENVTIEFDTVNNVQIPAIGGEIGSEGHHAAVVAWANENQIELSAEIRTYNIPQEKLKVFTFMPEVNIVLQEKEDERQLVGLDGTCHLPFYSHSFISANGVSAGVPDISIPMQDNVNISELSKQKWKHCVPPGKSWVHPLSWAGQPEKQEELLNNINDPTVPFVPSEGAPPNKDQLFGWVNGPQVPPDIIRSESFDIGMMAETNRLPPAVRGQSERSGESARLFSRKVTEANVMVKQTIDRLEELQKNFFHDYKILAIQVYGGRNEIEKKANEIRTVSGKEGQEVRINQEQNMADVPENEILVKVTKKNNFLNAVKREEAADLYSLMPPTATNGATRALLEVEIATNMEGVSEEVKDQIREIGELSVTFNKLSLLTQIKNLQMQNMQMDMQMQMPAQPQTPGQESIQPQGQPAPQGQPV